MTGLYGSSQRNDYVHLAKLRLDWANAGIDRLEILVDTFLSSKPSEMITSVKQEGDKAHFTYVLRIYNQPPPTVRFAVGDVVHNLRSTIDNLVWGIGQIYQARNDLSLEFHSTKSSFLDCYVPKINILPNPIYDWIESIQPYHKGHYIKSFHIIHQLWNRDKHRSPNIINTAGLSTYVGYVGDNPFSVTMQFNRRASGQKDQQKIAEAIVPWERRDDFKPEFFSTLAFNERSPVGLDPLRRPYQVIPHLRAIQRYIVVEIIPKFEPYLCRI